MTSRSRIDVTGLDPLQLGEMLIAVADVVIALDDNYVVRSVADSANVDDLTRRKWIGRKIVDLASPESAPKVARILREETDDAQASRRWRHVNFLDAAKRNVPLLVKYFQLNAGPVATRLIVGRDLRPVEDAQRRVQQAIAEGAFGAPAPRPPRADPAAAIDELLGRKPFDTILLEASDLLERTFFAEALKRADGDTAQAARLLGLDHDDFMVRWRRSRAP